MEGSGTVSFLNDDWKRTDSVVEVGMMRKKRVFLLTEQMWQIFYGLKLKRCDQEDKNETYPSLLGIEFGDNAIKDKFISISKEMLICLLQREATQRDVERERRQRMEAEARVREATAEAERARSRVHHLQRELAR